jgi:hypothetical protein
MLKKIAIAPLFSFILFFSCTKNVEQEKTSETTIKSKTPVTGMEKYFENTIFLIKDEKGNIVSDKKFSELTSEEKKNIPPPPPPRVTSVNEQEKSKQLNDLKNEVSPKYVEITTVEVSENGIHNTASVNEKPTFPGGMDKFYQFVAENFKAPSQPNLKGKVYITFIVEIDGSLNDFKILRDIGYGTGEEAVRVLKSCPKWIPGKINGKAVRTLYSLPITIQSKI